MNITLCLKFDPNNNIENNTRFRGYSLCNLFLANMSNLGPKVKIKPEEFSLINIVNLLCLGPIST